MRARGTFNGGGEGGLLLAGFAGPMPHCSFISVQDIAKAAKC